MKRTFALAAGLAWTGISAASTYDLAHAANLTTGSWPRAVAIGDVTGDGLDDVVLGTDFYFDEANDHRIFIYSQGGDGSLGQPVKFRYAEREGRLNPDIKLGDLDKDGILDVVVGHAGGVTFLRAKGGGGFVQSTIETPVESVSTNIRLMDIDLDGNLDVIALYNYEGGVLLFGDGNGGVAEQEPIDSYPQSYKDLAVGDVTGDGNSDLVMAWSSGLFVYPHNGVDGFGDGVRYEVPAPGFSDAVAVGDFNGDGWNDIAVNTPAHTPEAGVWIYQGSSAGVFGTPTKLETFNLPSALIGADLDRNGRTDLLVGHNAWSAVGRYMQYEDGLSSELITTTVFNDGPRALAVGDWNDDGCTDAAIAGGLSGMILLQGRTCAPVKAVSDFNGDGRSDLFWHHAGTGANVIWRGGDYRDQQPVVRVSNPAWQVQGHGDFDGDGRADVLWRNVATGAGAIWRSGDFATQQSVTRVANLDWTIAGIGDFNGDGKDDLLWRNRRTGQNAIWKSGNYRDQQAITAVTDPRWTVVAVDDFNGDRKDDILWRNTASGGNAIWRSGNYRAQQPVTGVRNQDWQVAGTGDFNGDDRADILWRNGRSGTTAIWNAADIDDQSLVAGMDDEWVVAAIGDHDGNRNDEIVWRNRVTGENRIWRAMNATLEFPVTDVSNPAWGIQP